MGSKAYGLIRIGGPMRVFAAELLDWVTRRDVDRWDWTCVIGLVLFGAGLWRWFHLGVALTVVGGLVLLLGVAGARGEELATRKPKGG